MKKSVWWTFSGERCFVCINFSSVLFSPHLSAQEGTFPLEPLVHFPFLIIFYRYDGGGPHRVPAPLFKTKENPCKASLNFPAEFTSLSCITYSFVQAIYTFSYIQLITTCTSFSGLEKGKESTKRGYLGCY